MAGANKVSLADIPLDSQGVLTLAAENAAIDRSEVSDPFWIRSDFDILKWNKQYPYQLIVVDVIKDPSGSVSYVQHKNAVYTLPFAPESIERDRPIASTLEVTLGGTIETNNGSPIEHISFSGTTGFLPKRATSPDSGPLQDVDKFSFGLVQGTVTRLAGIGAEAQGFSKSFLANANNVHLESEFTADSILSKTSGYYQMLLLQEFFEQYGALKKSKAGKDVRLALAIWKDGEVLLITPQRLRIAKNAASPLEYRYSLESTAFKRIRISAGGASFIVPDPVRNNPSKLASIIDKLSAARKIIQDVGNIPQAVLGDINRINEVFRQSIGICKDLAGATQNFADLPTNVQQSVVLKMHQNSRDFRQASKQMAVSVSSFKKNWLDKTVPIVAAGGGAKRVSRNPAISNNQNRDLIDVAVDALAPYMDSTDRANVVQDSQRVRNLTRSDFEKMRDDLVIFVGKLSFLLGVGDSVYSNTYGIGSIDPIKEAPTDSDWDVLFSLNDAVQALDSLAATGSGEPSEPAMLMDSMATLARSVGVAFQVPTSKFAVPFPYGTTLEGLSAKYLGDPNRWMEIATLNGLRAPYVDEQGFDLPLVVNGNGNTVVTLTNPNIYLKQSVTISSRGATKNKRRVVDLKVSADGKTYITLDGVADLDKYRVSDGAFIHAYLPDTVNSESLIYIPSDKDPIENDYITKDIPGVDSSDPLVAVAGIDFLMDNHDLIITPDGDQRWATGLTHIVQSVETQLSVRQRRYLLHPSYGLPVEIGTASSDIDARSILLSIKKMLESDSVFSTVGAVKVVQMGPALSIDTSVSVAGNHSSLPLTFSVR